MSHKICVLGLGYIGLPTACILAAVGHHVVGVDTNTALVDRLNQGEPHIDEPGLDELFSTVVAGGNIRFSAVPEPADVYILAVPTPASEDRTAVVDYVVAATESIVPYLRPGNLLVVESTVPPGLSDEIILPILVKTGLDAGVDILVAHAPERVIPGRTLYEIIHNDRIVGGTTEAATVAAYNLYSSFVKGTIYRTNARTAEAVKLMENTFRDVNIALANEFAMLCERLGVDVWEAIRLANCHPRVNILRPGPGVGGHCIAVDPWFLVQEFPGTAKLIRTARQVNDAMPEHVVELVSKLAAPPDKIAVLGLAYKSDTGDLRESPAVTTVEALVTRGYTVSAYDPFVSGSKFQVSTLNECLRGATLILLLTDHTCFTDIDVQAVRALVKTPRVLDTRGVLNADVWRADEFEFFRLGTPQPIITAV